MQSRDPRYDGFFVVAVTSTGVYCRPSCPARLPSRRNVRLLASAAAAQEEGFRACKRCDPDAAPGSPAWNRRADVAGRAVRLIADGAVDREGVGGLASRLHFSERQLNRILVSELGAGPVALARAQRAQTARTLIQSTDLPFGQVALGSGFRSVRQFNDTVRAVYARTPTELRRRAPGAPPRVRGDPAAAPVPRALRRRVADRVPRRAGDPGRRGGGGIHLPALALARARRRRSCRSRPPRASSAASCASTTCATSPPRWRARAGCSTSTPTRSRSPPSSSRTGRSRRSCASAPACAFPAASTASSSASGRSSASRCPCRRRAPCSAAWPPRYGEPLPEPDGGAHPPLPERRRARGDQIQRRFRSRARARGRFARSPGSARTASFGSTPAATPPRPWRVLSEIPGVGPWTSSYVAMRALGDPDVFLPGDVGLRHALARLGARGHRRALAPLALLRRDAPLAQPRA